MSAPVKDMIRFICRRRDGDWVHLDDMRDLIRRVRCECEAAGLDTTGVDAVDATLEHAWRYRT